jgi:hypothetical protein
LFREAVDQQVLCRVDSAVAGRVTEVDRFAGVGRKPRLHSSWELFQLKRQCLLAVRTEHLQVKAREAEALALLKFNAHRRLYLERSLCEALSQGFLDGFAREVASAVLDEGLRAKQHAERLSGILFPRPAHMQYAVYCKLRDQWKERKQQLARRIAQAGAAAMEANTEAKAVKELEAEITRCRDADEEKKRQEHVCEVMAKEELRCRTAWREELQRCLRERRAMATEEKTTRQYMRWLEKMQSATVSSYTIRRMTFSHSASLRMLRSSRALGAHR